MSRFIPPHPQKGSAEAYAWAERMRIARKAKGKRIRRLGKQTERMFFRKGKLKQFGGMEAMTGKNPGRPHGTFRRCVKDVKKSLKHYHRKGSPEAICGATLSRKYSKNPIAIFGNPPKAIHANVSGVLYNEVLEIRARKTHFKKGYYKHPFETNVQLLALDNGDLLVHSLHGHHLWERN